MSVPELSYNLLKTQIITLSANISNLERLVPPPNYEELSNNPIKNIYLGVTNKPVIQLANNKCPSLEVDNCEDITYMTGNESICSNYYMKWKASGKYCDQLFFCAEKQFDTDTFTNCGVNLDSSCTKVQDISGVWRKFI